VQVFDVVLNGQITVVDGLDIFAKVGRGVAHDEIIPFSIRNSQLQYGAETAPFTGKLIVEFVKVTPVLQFISLFSVCIYLTLMPPLRTVNVKPHSKAENLNVFVSCWKCLNLLKHLLCLLQIQTFDTVMSGIK